MAGHYINGLNHNVWVVILDIYEGKPKKKWHTLLDEIMPSMPSTFESTPPY